MSYLVFSEIYLIGHRGQDAKAKLEPMTPANLTGKSFRHNLVIEPRPPFSKDRVLPK
jgi:hypothetical protein